MTTRNEIQFLLNDTLVTTGELGATDTVLDFLRIDQRLTGSKEGCAEGDCGACTVLVGRLVDGGLEYKSVNACIRFLASLDGCHVVTVEHLKGADGGLHPVQQAMVDFHGSQCGFCTPGIIMSLYALWMENPSPTVQQVETALQGNLCRCTGYEPIIRAAMALGRDNSPAQDFLQAERKNIENQLSELSDGRRVVVGPEDNRAILPANLDDLAKLLEEHPDATIVSGATDVGLWVTKFLQPISPAIFVADLDELKKVEVSDSHINIGAAVTYTEFEEAMNANLPQLGEYWNRIAGWQVRNMGTIGGNVANGSPIGDAPPVLIALGAQVTLRKGSNRRVIDVEDYFIDYGKQDQLPGEFVEQIRIPLPAKTEVFSAYKISKRRDEDISSVAVGILVSIADGVIDKARIAYGGMAGTPKRATTVESELVGKAFTADVVEAAAGQLGKDFSPLSDWRASADYRLLSAQNLLRRFHLENTGGPDELSRLSQVQQEISA
ncbi:MAG: xanthine dehydrogenase small subunit [Rhizobiaceae bacterium]|nr:xanthine dehydrogenase small subunit [Rhizobiaceae bacterium]